MTYGSPGYVLEHGSSRGGRWLRSRRLRIALWIAVIEGLLVVVHVIPRWPALLVALGLVAFYLVVGRRVKAYSVRQMSWIAAASQALMVLIPLALILLSWLAILALAILAVVALVALLADRR